jgi:hypothetical protein
MVMRIKILFVLSVSMVASVPVVVVAASWGRFWSTERSFGGASAGQQDHATDMLALETGRRPVEPSDDTVHAITTLSQYVDEADTRLCDAVSAAALFYEDLTIFLPLARAFPFLHNLHISGCVLDRDAGNVLSRLPLKTVRMFRCRGVASMISKLPKTIEDLSIGWYGWKEALSSLRLALDLPRLRVLWLSDCDGIDLLGGLPRSLEVLYIISCKGVLLPERFPPGLTRVTLLDCGLAAIPPQVLALSGLKYLDVGGNPISRQEVYNARGEPVEVVWDVARFPEAGLY